jgi:hypothetical protein
MLVARLGERWEESMTIVAILCAIGAYVELYVALGERNPWVSLFVGLALAFLSNVAARMAVSEAAAVSMMARHSAMRAISQRITRLLPMFTPAPRRGSSVWPRSRSGVLWVLWRRRVPAALAHALFRAGR